jgi:DNA-binding NarL/FixJ family response regulator
VLIGCGDSSRRRQWRDELRRNFTVREAREPAALQQSLTRLRPGVLVLDSGLCHARAIPTLHRLSPQTKIVFLATKPDEREGFAVLRSGALAYGDVAADPALLRKAVAIVETGEMWICREVLSRVLARLWPASRPRPPFGPVSLQALTSRQRQVATLVAHGASNQDVANQLGITEATVKAHLMPTFRKLGLSGRLSLAVLILGRRPLSKSTHDGGSTART